MNTPATPPAAARLPRGVYMTHSRESAILFKHTDNGVWYLTFITGKITLEHCGEDKFSRDFPMVLKGYPLLRAVRMYDTSNLERDEQCAKVLRILLRM